MTKEQMISKMNEFIEDYSYANGFTAYMAYCYVFDIQYDEYIRIDCKEMSYGQFMEWLEQYIYEFQDDYEQGEIIGCYDVTYINKNNF